jgi:hypothetical protein
MISFRILFMIIIGGVGSILEPFFWARRSFCYRCSSIISGARHCRCDVGRIEPGVDGIWRVVIFS